MSDEGENPIVSLLRDMGKCVITITAENREGVATVIMPMARFDNYISVIRKDSDDMDPVAIGNVQAMQFLFRVDGDAEGNMLYALPFTRHEDVPKVENFELVDLREDPPTDDIPQTKVVDERDEECKKVWPDCYSGDYNPACCRFPKSCSAGITRLVTVEER